MDHIAMRVLTLFIVLADIALVIASIFDSDENQHIYTIISVVVVSYFLIEVRCFNFMVLVLLLSWYLTAFPGKFWGILRPFGGYWSRDGSQKSYRLSGYRVH